MAEDLIPSRPLASLYAHCNTLAYDEGHIQQLHDSFEADHYQGLYAVMSDSLRPLGL